ncbi:MAG: tetratricopeptide repeat protein [bacterium]
MKINYYYLTGFISAVLAMAYFIFPTSKQVGIIYKKSFLYNEALVHLLKAKELNPKSRQTLINLADIYRTTGDFKDETETVTILHRLYPNNQDYLKRLSGIYEWQGDLENLLYASEKLFQLNPGDTLNKKRITELMIILGKYDKLVQNLESDKNENFKNLRHYRDILKYYWELKDYNKIEKCYERMVKISQTDQNLFREFGNYYLLTGQREKIPAVMQKLLNSPQSRKEDFKFVMEYYSYHNFKEEELRLLGIMQNQFPQDYEITLKLAGRYAAMEHYSDAIRLYENILHFNPQARDERKTLANLYAWSNQPSLEIKQLELAADNDTLNPELMERLAQRHEWADSLNKAVEVYEKLNSINPDPHYQQKLITLYRTLNYEDRYIALMEHMVSNDTLKERKEYLLLLAQTFLAENEWAKAINYFRTLEKMEPDAYTWQLRIGEIFRWQGRDDSAMVYLESAVKKGYSSQETYFLLGEYYFWKQMYDRSIDYLQKCRGYEKKNSLTQYYLAESWFYKGNLKKAEILYGKFYKTAKNINRKGFIQEAYFITCSRLGKISELARAIMDINVKSPNFDTYLNSIIINLFDKQEFAVAADLLDYFRVHQLKIDKILLARIKDEVIMFKEKGRWDLANHFMGYAE